MALRRWLLVSICGLFLTACSDSGKPAVESVTTRSTQAKAADSPAPGVRVALIMKTLTNPFFVEMEKGARRAQRATGIDLHVQTATQETSIEQQIQLVEQEIQAKAQAIVIAPGDSTRLVPVLKKAQDAGIHVVNIDNRLSAQAMQAVGMKPVPFISVDNEKGAYKSAKFVADQVTRPTQAAIIEGIRTADNAQQRKLGAERAFQGNPHLKVVAQETANWKIDEAYEVVQRIFKTHPHIGVLFCANDMMAIGAIKYLQESGKKHVLVAGFDALEEAKAALRAGQMAATIDQQASEQGYLGITTALQMLAGQTVPMDVQVEAALVTAQTLQ
jgi:ribose transport system substrate-binding protein